MPNDTSPKLKSSTGTYRRNFIPILVCCEQAVACFILHVIEVITDLPDGDFLELCTN